MWRHRILTLLTLHIYMIYIIYSVIPSLCGLIQRVVCKSSNVAKWCYRLSKSIGLFHVTSRPPYCVSKQWNCGHARGLSNHPDLVENLPILLEIPEFRPVCDRKKSRFWHPSWYFLMNSLDTYTSTPESWPLTPPSGSRLRRSVIRRSLKNIPILYTPQGWTFRARSPNQSCETWTLLNYLKTLILLFQYTHVWKRSIAYISIIFVIELGV